MASRAALVSFFSTASPYFFTWPQASSNDAGSPEEKLIFLAPWRKPACLRMAIECFAFGSLALLSRVNLLFSAFHRACALRSPDSAAILMEASSSRPAFSLGVHMIVRSVGGRASVAGWEPRAQLFLVMPNIRSYAMELS